MILWRNFSHFPREFKELNFYSSLMEESVSNPRKDSVSGASLGDDPLQGSKNAEIIELLHDQAQKSIFPSFCDVRNYRSDPDSARTYGSDRIRNPACISTSSIIAAKRVIPTVVFVIILSGLYPESHEITSPLFAL